MKYDLYFDTEDAHSMGGGDLIETWKHESVVPRVGDSVFMKIGGWKTITSVSFSGKEKKKRRNVLITVK